MMTPAALLADLTARGFTLADQAGVLVVVPGSALTEADREAIRRHKLALLDLLTPDDGDIPIGTDAPVLRRAEPGDRRTVAEELDDLAAWAATVNEDAHRRWVKKHGGE